MSYFTVDLGYEIRHDLVSNLIIHERIHFNRPIYKYLFGLNDGEIEVIALGELLSRSFDDIEDVPVSASISLEDGVFLDEQLDTGQIGTELEAFEHHFRLVDPRVHIIHARVELLLLPGLRQVDALHLGGPQQLLPHLYDLFQLRVDPCH